jgi:hypothetical protein
MGKTFTPVTTIQYEGSLVKINGVWKFTAGSMRPIKEWRGARREVSKIGIGHTLTDDRFELR